MRRTEEMLCSREQVVGYLREALSVVDEIEPPEDLRPAVFAKAADLVAAKQVFFEQAQTLPFDPTLLRASR